MARIGLQTQPKPKLNYHFLFNHADDAMLVWEYAPASNSFNIIDANKTACERYAYNHAQIVGLSGADLNSDESLVKGRERNTTQQLFKTGHCMAEITHKAKDGRLIPTEVRACLLRVKGKILVLSLCRDISSRKEEERNNEENLVNALLSKRLEGLLQRLETAAVQTTASRADKNKKLSDLVLSPSSREISYHDRKAHLTPIEGCILRQLANKTGSCVNYKDLTHLVWGDGDHYTAKQLRVHIRNIRDKLEEDPHKPTLIITKPCQGYCLSKKP